MPNKSIDIKIFKDLAKIIEDSNLTEIEYEADGVKLKISRQANITYTTARSNEFAPAQTSIAPQTTASAPISAEAPKTVNDYEKHAGTVKSPMVGVVYLAPEPGAPPYIKEGDIVTADQTLMLIEAMKTFNPVKATKAGKVVKILVEDGIPVEYDQPLLVVE